MAMKATDEGGIMSMTDGKKFSTQWVVCDYCQTEWRRVQGERTEQRDRTSR